MKKETFFTAYGQSAVPDSECQERLWRVLLVDDDEDIHTVSKMALSDFEFQGRRIEFIDAYSAAEAKAILEKESDIALILLDVVMERDKAGLELVEYIRGELDNQAVRIVLRTGQPGQAPEQRVVREFDINDYKHKSELTSAKLHTLCYANLRAYNDINTLTRSKKGLEKLICASRGISSRQALNSFVFVTMKQLITLLNLDDTSIFSCETDVFRITEQDLEVFENENGLVVRKRIRVSALPKNKRKVIMRAIAAQRNVIHDNHVVMYCANGNHTILFYARTGQKLSELDTHILGIFTENLVVILENIRLNEMIESSQREIIYRLGEVVESRSNETGNHVKRVAHYSEQLALLIGLSADEAELIKLASPLHDIGKIAIPDDILQKPGPLDEFEWTTMQTHTQKGYDILKDSSLAVMSIGASIAISHHERWDGSGYPRGLREEGIPIYGRITALADVYDALCSERCYKKAWPHEDILAYIAEQKGRQFDPRLVDLFLTHIDRFEAIKKKFPA